MRARIKKMIANHNLFKGKEVDKDDATNTVNKRKVSLMGSENIYNISKFDISSQRTGIDDQRRAGWKTSSSSQVKAQGTESPLLFYIKPPLGWPAMWTWLLSTP